MKRATSGLHLLIQAGLPETPRGPLAGLSGAATWLNSGWTAPAESATGTSCCSFRLGCDKVFHILNNWVLKRLDHFNNKSKF